MTRRITCLAALLGIGALALTLWSGRPAPPEAHAAPGSDPTQNQNRGPKQDDGLIVHEWGTFTTYSGSDGVRLEFRPLFDSDLPPFVYDRALQSGLGIFTKTNYRAQVRMETPITYFYTDRVQDVRVRVDFPQGLLTEFYPPVASISPPYKPGKTEPTENSSLDWGTVTLIPAHALRVNTGNERVDAGVAERIERGLLPQSPAGNHYDAARATDAALVHVHRIPDDTKQLWLPQGSFFEKFLFYRGLGNFPLPLRATAEADGRLAIQNLCQDPINAMFVMHVDDAGLRFAPLGALAAQADLTTILPTALQDPNLLGEALTSALVAEGLYEKEARAMVATWRDSWFLEHGTRLLYLVPEVLVDEMLPLHIDPQPAQTVRVMVGRMEVMTAADEAHITSLVAKSAAARAAAEALAKANNTPVSYAIPQEIRELGRLAEPAVSRVRHLSTDPVMETEAGLLLYQLNQERSQ